MLKQIKPDQRGRFETNFPKNEGDDHELRPELAKQLGSTDEFRTAIAILDNRESEKQSADAIVKALQQTSWWGLAASPDPLTILVTISGMEPKDRAQFEKNFPLNEGEGLNLREQLAKYLGANEQYDLIIKMLDEYKGQAPPLDAPVAEGPQQPKPQLSSIGDWLDAFKKLNQTLGISGVADIDPRNVNESEFKEKYAAEAVKAGAKIPSNAGANKTYRRKSLRPRARWVGNQLYDGRNVSALDRRWKRRRASWVSPRFHQRLVLTSY